jgi:hypothetical protein
VSLRGTAQVPLRRAAAASEPGLLRNTQESCDNKMAVLLVLLSCFVFSFFIFCCVCLYSTQDEMENVSPTLKDSLNFISLSIKYFLIKLQYYPSTFHSFKMSAAPSVN